MSDQGDRDLALRQQNVQLAQIAAEENWRSEAIKQKDRQSKREKKALEGQAAAQQKMGKAQLKNARVASFQTSRSTAMWILPMVSTVILLFVILGPGLTSALEIISSIPWYAWIGVVFVGLLLWRRR